MGTSVLREKMVFSKHSVEMQLVHHPLKSYQLFNLYTTVLSRILKLEQLRHIKIDKDRIAHYV